MDFRLRSAVTLLVPGAKADTAAATGSWISVSKYKGELIFILSVGTVTAGQIVPVIQDATDSGGTGVATLAMDDGAWTTVTTSNDPLVQVRRVNASGTRGFIRVLGTITTGPVDASCTMLVIPAAGE